MAHVIRPVAKVVYVCDDVAADSISGKVSLLNLWDSVRVSPDRSFPFQLEKVCVFAWWRDGAGEVRTRIDIVQASTGEVIRRTRDCIIRFDARPASVFARYKLENRVFPKPDYYYVELYCEDDFVGDQFIRVFAL